MYLIETSTLRLVEFPDIEKVPGYAVLSHRWRDKELLFKDMKIPFLPEVVSSSGYRKVHQTCRQALKDGLLYAWCDTCCIDKSSSAELSEAINSMYRIYENAAACYAYLDDTDATEESFEASEWFTRGWTLQELLAPRSLEFYNRDWRLIGTRSTLRHSISKVTGIESVLLDVGPQGLLDATCVAQKMSWAAERKTTRVEDIAYCLLGIFKINMPVLYGEGNRAFRRLQEEIIKVTEDHTIFAWTHNSENNKNYSCMLAESPENFRNCSGLEVEELYTTSIPCSMTNRGLHIEAPLIKIQHADDDFIGAIILNCRKTDQDCMAIPIRYKITDGIAKGYRLHAAKAFDIKKINSSVTTTTKIYVHQFIDFGTDKESDLCRSLFLVLNPSDIDLPGFENTMKVSSTKRKLGATTDGNDGPKWLFGGRIIANIASDAEEFFRFQAAIRYHNHSTGECFVVAFGNQGSGWCEIFNADPEASEEEMRKWRSDSVWHSDYSRCKLLPTGRTIAAVVKRIYWPKERREGTLQLGVKLEGESEMYWSEEDRGYRVAIQIL